MRRSLIRLTRFFPRMRQVVTEVPFDLAPPEFVDAFDEARRELLGVASAEVALDRATA